jgi:segregation and condensation protein B
MTQQQAASPDKDTAQQSAETDEPAASEQPVDAQARDDQHAPQREEPCSDQPLAMRIEALLLSSDRPLTEARLAELLGIESKGAAGVIRETTQQLNSEYESTGRSFRAERLAGGWQLLTIQPFGPLLARLHTDRQSSRLSQAALETLSIIAYRQPIMRAEVEAIRGVASGEVLRGLLERRLIKIAGRAEELGRPMLYGTTQDFLKVFGLASLDDLPAVQGAKA